MGYIENLLYNKDPIAIMIRKVKREIVERKRKTFVEIQNEIK